MNLNNLTPALGEKHYKKRVGRGIGSGMGKTATRGHNGQNARSGGGVRPGYEGGQTPLFKRLPKRGFTCVNHVDYAIVNIEQLNVFEAGSVIDLTELINRGLVSKKYEGVKILGKGQLTVALTVKKGVKLSASASEAIKAAGGNVEVE